MVDMMGGLAGDLRTYLWPLTDPKVPAVRSARPLCLCPPNSVHRRATRMRRQEGSLVHPKMGLALHVEERRLSSREELPSI